VRKLVENGDADLVAELVWVGEALLQWHAVDRDRVRREPTHVSAVWEWDAVVKTEEIRVFGVLVLDDDGDVLERSCQMGRQLIEGGADMVLEGRHPMVDARCRYVMPDRELGVGPPGRVACMPTFAGALNDQIGHEFGAAQQYIAIAVYYDAQTLPELAAHFYRQALEERNHAMMIVQYLLDSDQQVVVPGVEPPKTDFSDAVAPVALALAQEKRVTEQIVTLVKLARDEGELVGEQFLHWFLQEQREEVASMTELLAIVERGRDNLLHVEEYLSRSAGGENPLEAGAPPVAGGAL